MLRKIRQFWCWFRHDHRGISLLGQTRYRCKVCGYEGKL
jgi:hypothetical protein